MNRRQIIDAINAERKRQDTIHPVWKGDLHGLAVLAEEFGEVARDVYELTNCPEELNDIGEHLETELIHVASVCVRWLEMRDSNDRS